MKHLYTHILISCCLLFLASCSKSRGIAEGQPTEASQKAQAQRLTLEEAININYWLTAAQSATQKPLQVPLPYRQTGFFLPGTSEAVALKFNAKRGQKVQVFVKSQSSGTRLFADITCLSNKNYIPAKSTCEPANSITYEFTAEQTGNFLLRFQPELMKTGKYEVEIHTGPSIVFPVLNKCSKAIGSFWGAVRDNGKRTHQGVDVFAPIGTPVVAVSNGHIYSTGCNILGGNYVRLFDSVNNRTYYYAHLDTILTTQYARVNAGDILGTIGKTGNAHNTPPHLHFSIYCGPEGAVDPLPYIQNPHIAPPAIADPSLAGTYVRVAAPRLNVRQSPSTAKNYFTTLLEDEVCQVLAVTENWLLVSLPDNKTGFISADYVTPVKETSQQVAQNKLHPINPPDTIHHGQNLITISSMLMAGH